MPDDDEDDDAVLGHFFLRAKRRSIALVMSLAALTSLNDDASAAYTCATGTYDDYNHVIKYPNQRRQRPIVLNGVTYQADLIEQSATNLLAAGTSECFDVTWTVGSGAPTVTANAAAAPPGAITADSLIEGVANGFQTIQQSITKAASALGYVASFYVKNASGSRNLLIELDDGTTTNGVSMKMNPSTGALVSAPATFGTGWSSLTSAMPTGYSITDGGSGYWRVCLAATSDTATTIRLRIGLQSGGTSSYAGDGTSGVYLWGADVCNCNWPCSHISNRNLLARSEDLTNASWGKTRSSTTADSVANPLTGDVTADTFTEDGTASNTHFTNQTNVAKVASSTLTFSIYAKAGTRSWILVAMGATGALANGVGAYFDLTNGATGGSFTAGTGWTLVSKTITSPAAGWYRCVITVATDGNAVVAPTIRMATADGTSSYSGNGTGNVYLYGAQLEYGAAATTYWSTGASTVGTRAASFLLTTLTPSTTTGTLIAVVIPYGWSGHYNDSTVYRILSNTTTAAACEIRSASTASSHNLSGTRTDSLASSKAVGITPAFLSGVIGMPSITWGPSDMSGFMNGVASASSSAATPPWASGANLTVGPTTGSGSQPNAYVLGLVSSVVIPDTHQQVIFNSLSAT